MYIKDGIAYAGEPAPVLQVSGVRAMDNYMLWVRFNTGEAKVVDFKPLLEKPAFAPLADMETFRGVYIDYGVVVWHDGEIDIAPEALYDRGIAVESVG